MQPIKINVVGTLATITQNVTLTTGLVGQTVAFTFDKAWDGLSRCAVFKAGNSSYTQLNIGEEATIPPELLRIQGRQLSVGVYGFNADGTVVIPTVWTILGAVKHGAHPNDQESATPALPIWAQLEEQLQELKDKIGNGGGDCVVQYITSTAENPVYLRGLESGIYQLVGTFYYAEGINGSLITNTPRLAIVGETDSFSAVRIFYATGADITYKIEDTSFTKYDMNHLKMLTTDDLVAAIDSTADDEHIPTAKAVKDYIPFRKIGGEYNEIAKAVEVSTAEELLAVNGNAILPGYRYYRSIVTHTDYSLLKIPVKPGDVIRDKLCTFWKDINNTSAWLWVTFFNESGTSVGEMRISYAGSDTYPSNFLEIRENGITVPDGTSYALVNIYIYYECEEGTQPEKNGVTANIITVNQNADLTYYDGVSHLADYVPQTGTIGDYYEAVDDVRIPRYENALGDIETALDSIIATQESLIGG